MPSARAAPSSAATQGSDGVDGPSGSSAAGYDRMDPRTYTPESFRDATLVQFLQTLNDIPRRGQNAVIVEDPAFLDEIRHNILVILSNRFQALRRFNDQNVLSRSAMFSAPDGASAFRPTFGLKRTFLPRF